ncbi:hypothetical protein TNCV_816761 [Trichonephila clavipes]|nr:hypothetical protein TNCV_816761 [Trichonephila clavipes]
MVWTISLEEFLINGSILQGSKRSSTLQLDSEFRKELNLDHSFRVPSGAPHSKKPTKEYLFRIGIAAAMFQKKDPVTLRQKDWKR